MFFGGRKPDWLYQALPYLYATAGIVTVGVLPGMSGLISGALLVSAAVTVWKLRTDHRKQMANRPTQDLASPDFGGQSGTVLVKMIWHPALEIGHDQIDRQHRRLFSIGNDLINGLLTNRPQADIELMLDDLIVDIGNHFKSEMEIMAKKNVQLSVGHQEIHERLLTRIKELRDRFQEGALPASELVGFIAYDVVAQHIIKEDQKFAPAKMKQVATAAPAAC